VADVTVELDERAGVTQANGALAREQPTLFPPPRDRVFAARMQRLPA
jgi:hypothetical protein